MQNTQRHRGADGKRDPGINFVTLYTWTENGCIVLALDMTLGGESLCVVPMVEILAAEAGDGLHTLVYDRAVSGWILAHLMALYGIEVVNKAIARALRDREDSTLRWLIRKAQAEAALTRRRTLTGRALDLAVAHFAGEKLAAGHLPPGMSIYKTTGGYDVIDSAWRRFTEPHQVGHHILHQERLILDDEALFLEDENGNKGDLCETLHSTRERTRTGAWARRTQWRIPCDCGDWVLEKLWAPADTGPTPEDELTDRSLIAHIRPLPRAIAQFQPTHGRRSTSETENNVTKSGMAHYGRASHLHPNLQLLDHFSFGRVTNARTWQRHPYAWHPWHPRPSQRAWGPGDHGRLAGE
ncbi:hypothetical protein [Geodermatophilus saharensis]|uniref:hypothetical protein n=1 Tax=Geodermatophilus saharensis TaxID=1137994 RepID=UPI000B76C268|nr:hypothetical protein [Geodermatophilus saharensis]